MNEGWWRGRKGTNADRLGLIVGGQILKHALQQRDGVAFAQHLLVQGDQLAHLQWQNKPNPCLTQEYYTDSGFEFNT